MRQGGPLDHGGLPACDRRTVALRDPPRRRVPRW
jgi:hypothetical protein